MGGFGSGRHRSRPVVEETFRLDVRQLRPAIAAALADGTSASRQLIWRIGRRQLVAAHYRLCFSQGRLHLSLFESETPEIAIGTINMAATNQPLGGRRWWLCCPTCGRRSGVLYALSASWRCRLCARVVYRSSCESDKRLGPLLRSLEQFWVHGESDPSLAIGRDDRASAKRSAYAECSRVLRLQGQMQLLLKAQALGIARLEAGRPLYRSQDA